MTTKAKQAEVIVFRAKVLTFLNFSWPHRMEVDEDTAERAKALAVQLINWGISNMKLEDWHNSDDKRKFKIVRTDNYTDVPGDIVTADETTGECSLKVGDETKTLSFGPDGIRIIRRGR